MIKTIRGKLRWQALNTLRAYPFSTGAYSLDTHTIIVVPEKTLFGHWVGDRYRTMACEQLCAPQST